LTLVSEKLVIEQEAVFRTKDRIFNL
jgi:hypothetical protein